MNWRDCCPEWGIQDDPYVDEINNLDDWITDYRYNHWLLGLDPATGETLATLTEAHRLDFEIAVLDLWWSLQERVH